MKKFLKNYFQETKLLFRSIPSIIVAIFAVTVVVMNILSNKTIFQNEYIAIDGGFIISWVVFLIMDLITIHFGPKASIKLSIFAIIINLCASLIFYLISIIPTVKDYSAFNQTIGGTWFILISSSIAFLVSAVINAVTNAFIGKKLENKSKATKFVFRCLVSSLLGQIIDNLIFSTLTFMVFAPIFWNGFHWTFIQCLTCSITFALVEVIIEILFLPLGYEISNKWEKDGIGKIN